VQLTKLELHGFKSFADATVMTFEHGVTAIVGPNGCGKSNVADAVRWVLGEQRAKQLRGSKMEEVIFQGSTARRPVNISEVSLYFDNDDGEFPVAFREVVITRRLSRSGESDYLLNGAPCRLRDISDLLHGTGLGADTGVVIEARMVDALLSDRPDDRRELFDEAAGISLYRERRRSTERRLEETTTDLQRLDDLIAEVQTQVRSLSRQRKRSERYAELTARRFSVSIALASREMSTWHDELTRLEARVADLKAQVPESDESVSQQERDRDAAHQGRSTSEARRAELSHLVGTQREQVLHLRAEIAVAEERQRNSLVRRQLAEAGAAEGAVRGEHLSADRAGATAEHSQFTAQLEHAQSAMDSRRASEDAARESVVATRTGLEQADRALRDFQGRVHDADLAREKAQRELDETDQRSALLERERAQLADTSTQAHAELREATEARARSDANSTQQIALGERARYAERSARDADTAARTAMLATEESRTALESKVHGLETLEREHVGMAPAAARLLQDRERFGAGAVLGPLSDYLTTDQEAASLVERFLGASLHAVLVKDAAAADAVREWHRRTNPGPLLLLPIDAMAAADVAAPDALSGRVDAAPAARAWVQALLGRVRALGDGAAFVDAHGAVWLPGATAGAGPLQRRAALLGLKAELAASASARDAAAAAASAARDMLVAAELEYAASAERVVQAQRAAHDATERQAQLERSSLRLDGELAEATELGRKLRARCDALRTQLDDLARQHATVAEEIAEREAQVAAASNTLGNAQRSHDEARDLHTRAQVERAQIEARQQVAADRERRLNEEAESASARLGQLHAELAELSASDRAMAESLAAWRSDLSAREAAVTDGESRLAAAERDVRSADEHVTTAEHTLDEIRHRSSGLLQELHEAEVAFTELSGRRAAVRERLEAEWRKPMEALLSAAPVLVEESETLRAEGESLRDQIDQLGPVNVLAVEEHDETVKRFEFLTTQRADLADARGTLQQAIREIDSTARELFLTTFARVREHFREIFMTLFGGGECDLKLENPELPLDCDIEIHASPRGKRTQRIHLLSSGERSLVALSLLFGIFLTKPSPFCVLDEVDAPLDDANIGRFVRMLNQFKVKTQFIVITHNPRTTTEAADAVYGVTMQEPGVSSVVSVRMKGSQVDQEIAAVA
jgi:chromosome segregation protein